jgi:hypothetical protein
LKNIKAGLLAYASIAFFRLPDFKKISGKMKEYYTFTATGLRGTYTQLLF